LPVAVVVQLLTKGKTELIKDFTSHKSGKKFDAYLVFNSSTGRVSYEFPPRK
jgi:DNA topoisomerase-3